MVPAGCGVHPSTQKESRQSAKLSPKNSQSLFGGCATHMPKVKGNPWQGGGARMCLESHTWAGVSQRLARACSLCALTECGAWKVHAGLHSCPDSISFTQETSVECLRCPGPMPGE